MQLDFNSIFWKTWGVNHRVYTFEDVYRIKNKDTNKEKKKFFKFKNSQNMRDDDFIELLYKEANIFYLLFDNLFYKVENDISLEFIKELNNITFTYRFLDIFEIQNIEKTVNIFSFQIAYILENISKLGINISLFEESLKTNSFKPYILNYGKISNKNQNGIAHDLHTTFYNLSEVMSANYHSDMKDIDQTKVFVNNLIKWNKGSLPEFFKIIVMNVVFFSKKQKYEQRSQLILMLILRALLHIKREFNIDEEIEDQFLEKLENFRKIIKEKIDNKDFEKLNKFKLKYCIDFKKVLSEQNNSDSFDLNILFKYTVPFFSDIDKVNIEDDLLNKMIKYFKKYKVALLE
ncbi:hypothetical protein GCM10012288_22210 [Malaciobacter pacificus]|uniref:Uncharacterized protein n=1 Tax=Malaciobacter pacificus TaxID=1080223 RepID=A0A5C2HCP3_9BACT|nr:hypothetical protein [Malaciobacter pacificus]QEP34886.1 hypothetical protein APAC_1805 [Malaciobacter pacificus]GGD47539.1 hypothetical protein GCM10012288_22210 [Malaciobacter pacificus]